MLMLTRKLGEKISIGGGIEIEVRGIRGNRVQLSIIAPADVPVDRWEIAQRKLCDDSASK